MAHEPPLTSAEVSALREALADEHKAVAVYQQVIADFGDIRPFGNIVNAEHRHIRALERLFTRYGVAVPENPWLGRAPRFESVAEACAGGVAAEIDNAAMYDRLMAATARPDMLEVFSSLRRASQENHLPAFQRCQQRTSRDRGGETTGVQRRPRRHRHASGEAG
jgi:hypothetical protein